MATTRKAPKEHATDQKLGRILYTRKKAYAPKESWIVEKSGKTQRWNKATDHFTHDNGARPFYFKVKNGHLTVLQGKFDKESEPIYDKLVLSLPKYKHIWIGANTGKYANKREGECKGNSLLVNVKNNEYIYIGNRIFKFTTIDKIKEFHGIMGNSDVPYPIAIGTKNTYFFTTTTPDGCKLIPNELLNLDVDPNKEFFDNEENATKVKGQLIVKRD